MNNYVDIPNYEGYYKINKFGVVKSIGRNVWNGKTYYKTKDKIISSTSDSNGYAMVRLSKNGKTKSFKVHRLLAFIFLNLDITDKNMVIDHINNIKSDNRLENLQRITIRENVSKDRKNKTSKYTGVSLCKENSKWLANIKINNKSKFLGFYDKEIDAYKAYINAINNIY